MKRKVLTISLLLVMSLVVPASASISPETLTATLAPCESITETKTVYVEERPPKADVVFAFDLTGSMGGIIDTAKDKAGEIIAALDAIPDVDIQYGVMSYMDYPHEYDFCDYWASYGSPDCGDYAYSLDEAVTSDSTAVIDAIDDLTIGCGDDGPQDYTRIMYESYADPAVGWRTGAKRILVNFGDNVPHDCNLNEGVTSDTWSTGGDPGRDEIMGNADDLDLQTVLAAMKANGVVLLEAHTSDWTSWVSGLPVLDYWDYWTDITGGATYLTGSATLVDDIVNAVEDALEVPLVYGLHLEASLGFESWLESVSPPSHPEVEPGNTVEFEVTIHVPEGTEDGEYIFTISAVDEGGVSYGDQKVTITVPPEVMGRMTGGGSVFTEDRTRVTHGFELHCDASEVPNNLQVNWDKGNKFHLESLDSARCSDDPKIDEAPPVAGFDTYKGKGTGRYNGVSGATIEFTFTDAGEPGKNDFAQITITDASGVVLTVSGNLKNGNHQAHKE